MGQATNPQFDPGKPQPRSLWRYLWAWALGAVVALWLLLAGLAYSTGYHEAEEISITGSESYLRDIPLHDRRFRLSNTRKRLLGWFARKCHKKAAEDMNRRGDADMVCFYLKK